MILGQFMPKTKAQRSIHGAIGPKEEEDGDGVQYLLCLPGYSEYGTSTVRVGTYCTRDDSLIILAMGSFIFCRSIEMPRVERVRFTMGINYEKYPSCEK